MSRRVLAVLSLAVSAASLTACAESTTAPARPVLQPAVAPSHEMLDTGHCKGGWLMSEGRCA